MNMSINAQDTDEDGLEGGVEDIGHFEGYWTPEHFLSSKLFSGRGF